MQILSFNLFALAMYPSIDNQPAMDLPDHTLIEFEPDMGGVCSGSIMMNPKAAFLFFGGTNRLTRYDVYDLGCSHFNIQ